VTVAASPLALGATRNHPAKIGPLSGGRFWGELLDVAVGEHDLVAVQHSGAQHQGRTFDVTACQLMQLEAGQIVEVWGPPDQDALDSLWPAGERDLVSSNDMLVHHRDRPQWRRNHKARAAWPAVSSAMAASRRRRVVRVVSVSNSSRVRRWPLVWLGSANGPRLCPGHGATWLAAAVDGVVTRPSVDKRSD
jgi:hypothetical protein